MFARLGGFFAGALTPAGSDEGTVIVAQPTAYDFVGAGVTASAGAGGRVTVSIPGGGAGITIEDEGGGIAGGPHSTLNFVGAGVTAANAGGGEATITIPGGGGGINLEDEGGAVAGTPHTTFNFVGAGVTVTDAGAGEATITIPGGITGVNLEDEGGAVAGTPHTTLNFVGANVTVTDAGGGEATITVGGLPLGGGTLTGSLTISSPGTLTLAALTIGAVLFAGTGGVISEDPTLFFWDNATNRLGIGNAAPATALHVTGTIRASAGLTVDAFTLGSVLFAAAAGAVTQDNANFFWDDATNRLGIGNAAPAQALHVTGTIRASAGLIVDTMTAGSVWFAGASGALTQDNANFFWLDSTNALGLGTASPGVTAGHRLRVVGQAQFDGATNLGIGGSGTFNSASVYNSFVCGSMLDGRYDGAGNGGAYLIARQSASPGIPPVNAPFVALNGYDEGTARQLYFGGGGWGAPDSNEMLFWTAPTYTETTDTAVLRMTISALGQVVIGNDAADNVGSLWVPDAVGAVALRVTSASPSRIGVGGLRVGTDANPTAGTLLDQGGAGGARFGRTALATGVAIGLLFVAAAHTAQTASTEVVDVDLQTSGILQHATGALTTQRTVRIQARTYSFVAASTITNAATLAVEAAPIAGTNATLTRSSALWVQAGESRIDGAVSYGGDETPAILAAGTTQDRALGADVQAVRQAVDTTGSALGGLTGGRDGREVELYNISTGAAETLTLNHEDGGSTAANRFLCPAGAAVVIPNRGCAIIRYDATDSRWRVKSVT